jgi:maltose/maltodextrin transport system permease protein
MISNPVLRRILPPVLLTLVVLLGLLLATVMYVSGEWLLAGTLLVVMALAAWVYTSARTYAYRYLFPAIATALIFVVFPILYTISIGFTNYSSSNILEFPRATQYLLDQTYPGESNSFAFALYPDGSRYRIRLEDSESGAVFQTPAFAMPAETDPVLNVTAAADPGKGAPQGEAAGIGDVIAVQDSLKKVQVAMPNGARLGMTGLSEFAAMKPLYHRDGNRLVNNQDGSLLTPNFRTGFYETAAGDPVEPGFVVKVGFAHYRQIFTDRKFSEPFLKIFVWTVVFSGMSVLLTFSLGLVLAVLLSWEELRFRSLYRLLLFLPYAVPAFISILIFKGLFNNNTGEINLILHGLFGLSPGWFSDPLLAKIMLLIVNTWLGFPYMMVISMGLIKAIPADLYEASALAGAGPVSNLLHITLPLIKRPLLPLLIASFAFNFNNFVLVTLLTGGRPDFMDSSIPAGTTDILISYVRRIAFEDSGQKFGLAAAVSTVIFLMVAVLTVIQIKYTKVADDDKR